MGGGKGGGGGGPVTDPYELMDAAAHYNRISQYTPYGSVVFGGPNNTEATVTLSPEQQAILEGQQGLTLNALSQMMALGGVGGGNLADWFPSDTGYGLEGGAETQGPGAGLTRFAPQLDTLSALSLYLGGLPTRGVGLEGLPEMPGDFAEQRGNVEQAQFDRIMGLLRPEQERERSRLADMMAGRGVPETAALYETLSGRQEKGFAEQNLNAALEAVLAGGDEQSRLAGLGFQARGMGLNELLSDIGVRQSVRQQLLGELTGLYGLGRGEETEQFNRLAALLGMAQVGTPGASMAGFWNPGMVDPNAAGQVANQGWQLNQQYSLGNQLLGLAGTLGGAFLGAGGLG